MVISTGGEAEVQLEEGPSGTRQIVSFRLAPEIFAWLDEQAAWQGLTRTGFLEQVVRAARENNPVYVAAAPPLEVAIAELDRRAAEIATARAALVEVLGWRR